MIESIERGIFLLHLASTFFMLGVIWFVQVVHYPLFGRIAVADFSAYEDAHARLTARVVFAPMLIELATAFLLFRFHPLGISRATCVLGVMLLAVIWISTVFVQIPCHARLTENFEAKTHARLVASNWVRTCAWSARAIVVSSMAWSAWD